MKKFAYTLAEVVITMLIISVIVAISIKLTKSKLDNIISLTYYSAYDTLDSVVKEMKTGFKNSDVYTDVTDFDENYYSIVTAYSGENTCEEKPGQQLDETGNCHDIPNTIPKTGVHFCEMFRDMVNTNERSDQLNKKEGKPVECGGDKIEFNDTKLKEGIKADLVLRNGMRIYNLSQNPVELDKLKITEGNYENFYYSNKTEEDANNQNKIYTEDYGYKVYVDIDGSNGKSRLWEDIMPFFVTISGKVVPRYNTIDGKNVGGNNKDYLMISIFYWPDDAQPTAKWALKSVSFLEAACKSGYIDIETDYCNGINEKQKINRNNTETDCDQDNCGLQTITPIKWF